MGATPNLKLTTISEQDNPKVKDFFQDLAGDVLTSNMHKIDSNAKKLEDNIISVGNLAKEYFPTIQAVTIPSSGWTTVTATVSLLGNFKNTVEVPGVLSDTSKQIISWNGIDINNISLIAKYFMTCGEQGENSLTFYSKVQPLENININVSIQKIKEGV